MLKLGKSSSSVLNLLQPGLVPERGAAAQVMLAQVKIDWHQRFSGGTIRFLQPPKLCMSQTDHRWPVPALSTTRKLPCLLTSLAAFLASIKPSLQLHREQTSEQLPGHATQITNVGAELCHHMTFTDRR